MLNSQLIALLQRLPADAVVIVGHETISGVEVQKGRFREEFPHLNGNFVATEKGRVEAVRLLKQVENSDGVIRDTPI